MVDRAREEAHPFGYAYALHSISYFRLLLTENTFIFRANTLFNIYRQLYTNDRTNIFYRGLKITSIYDYIAVMVVILMIYQAIV